MKVLIADDSPTPRIMLERELRGRGHDCVVATDGVEAWEMFQGAGVDVVISDWMMPGMDGDEFCRRVRADPSSPYVYFILLTSLEGKHHVVAGMEAGADDYLTKPFDDEALATRLIAAERVTALHRLLADQRSELARLNAGLFEDSRRDGLTGVGNRRSQDEDLEVLAQQAGRYGREFSVGLFDIDRFKAFNDSAGHQAGDDVLRQVAGELSRQRRTGDAVYRYGGEELLVVFAGQDAETAGAGAERMRAAVEALAVTHPALEPHSVVTVSVGAACFDVERDTVAALLDRADAALYEAKARGRNRVVVKTPRLIG
jgi:two-component system, cell cycle response regulator